MFEYTYLSLIIKFFKSRKYTQQDFERIQAEKLRDMVSYARKKSPFYKRLYSSVPENFSLQDLPPVNKTMMMENFDEFVTDSKVKISEVRDFISDKSNIGRDFQGKYLVATTSGSTGIPSIVLHDRKSLKVAAIMSAARYMKMKFPLAALCVDDVFLIENGNIRFNMREAPCHRKKIHIVSAKDPQESICRQFNLIRPKVIVGYAGSIELLADQALAGNLSIKPRQILTSGEYLTPVTRAKIRKAFPKAEVKALYGCTEGNVIAAECPQQHFHPSSDYFILEPVDAGNKPVQDGVISDKVLLTVLSNFVQPIIRFEMTDRIVMHHEVCPCGKCGPWFTVEGRSNDILVMKDGNGNDTRLSPLPLIFVIEPLEGINNFQLVLHGYSDIELRIDFIKDANREKVFENARNAILNYLGKFGVSDVSVRLSDILPQRNERTGKFRQVYQEA